MTDAVAASRPRPRPVPRPKPKPKASSTWVPAAENAASTSTAAAPAPTKKASLMTEDDLDAMWTKNRNRSAQTWAKLEAMNKEVQKKKHDGSSSGSDSDEDDSPRSRKRARQKDALPKAKWQRDADVLRMLSQEPESDSDSDVVEIEDGLTTPRGNAKRHAQKQTQRDRSRSLTPPPMIPQQQVDKVRNFVRQALGESTTSVVPPPAELGARDQTAAAEASSSRASPAVDEDEDAIQIDVTWKPHPLDKSGTEVEWQYKISRTDNFQDLFEAIADDANIQVDTLVVCYQSKRIFASVNPTALNIWSDVRFTAYARAAYEHIRTHPDVPTFEPYTPRQNQPQTPRRGAPQGPIDISDSDDDDRNSPPPTRYTTASQTQTSFQPAQSQSQSQPRSQSVADDDEEDNKFKLVLRSALTGDKDITLTVRPTTKCGNILRAFLKRAGLDAQYPHLFEDAPAPPPPKTGAKRGRGGGRKTGKAAAAAAAAAVPLKDPRLCVDGDKMDNETPISEADLDDGDMVEVVGL